MRGGAQSHLMRAADGHYYVIKFVNNPQHRRVLANEWLAARLAHGLGLSAPPAALIEVPQKLVAASPGLHLRIAGQIVPCASGLQFGSRLPSSDPNTPIYDYLPEPGLANIANVAEFAGFLAFDKWTCNCNGRQVIYCRPDSRKPLKVFMVDQGFCFNAGDWNFPDSPLRGVYNRNLVYRGVTGWKSFEPWLARLERYQESAIYAAGEEIPPEWYGNLTELEALLERLVRRRSRVRELIWDVRNSPRAPFENWQDAAQEAATAG